MATVVAIASNIYITVLIVNVSSFNPSLPPSLLRDVLLVCWQSMLLPPSTDQPTMVGAATATGGATGSAPRQLLGLRVLANPDPATATAELLHVLRSQSGICHHHISLANQYDSQAFAY